MAEKPIAAIMMAALPTKTEYVVGFSGLDLTGGLLNLVYEDGSFEQVPLSEKMSYYVDNSKVGPANVTVQYAGLQAGFRIQVREPKLQKATIISPPAKTAYMEGETLDLTGLRLMGHYDNGQERELPIPPLSHTVQLGEAVVPLSVENLLIPILVQVTPSKPVSIKMRNEPKKTVFVERLEELDVTGGMVEKRLSNGRIELVPLTADMVTGFDNTKVGKQSLKVSYGGQTCSYEVEVTARRCERLELRSLPRKRNYIQGEPFDLHGIELIASKDGHTWPAPVDELTLQEPIAKAGATSMVVCYQGQSVEFPVTVKGRQLTGISIHTPPTTAVYKEPDAGKETEIDPAGGELALQYNNGEEEVIPLEQATVQPIQSGQIGTQPLQVSYKGLQTVLEVNVQPKQLLGIYISRLPKRTDYQAGEIFESDGMEVSAAYDNGQTATIDRYTFSTRPLAATDTTVVITYIDKTAVVPISVHEAKPIVMRRRKPPTLNKAERFYPGTLGLRFCEE